MLPNSISRLVTRGQQSKEPLHTYVFTIVKRLYYADLCERMTESRDLLVVMYDFIRLFKTGRINSNDVNEILQDIKKTCAMLFTSLFRKDHSIWFLRASTGNDVQDDEREQKIKMLGRLRSHMMARNPQATDTQVISAHEKAASSKDSPGVTFVHFT